jgi:hypothetical protein
MRLVVDARTSALANLVDYAGVFPPASLSVPDAVEKYRRARESRAFWMVGRFLIRATQLEELAAAATTTMARGEAPWETSVVFDTEPSDSASRASEFHAEMDPAMVVSAAEARITDGSEAGIRDLFTTVASINPEVVPFLEVDRGFDIEAQLRAIAIVVADAGRPGGAKIRCGGMTADLFPNPEEVAHFILSAVETDLPFKATAGLHQPFRHIDADLGVTRHGFINILMATAAAAEGANRQTVVDIISDTDQGAFKLSPAFATWRNLSIPGSALRRTRQRRFIAYGSCDFDEPVEALTDLGMMGEGS